MKTAKNATRVWRSWRGSAARIVTAGALAFAMGGGTALSAATAASAAESFEGTVTINMSTGEHRNTITKDGHTTSENSGVTYDAYRVFTGISTGDASSGVAGASWFSGSDNRLAEIGWENETVHQAVVGVIQAWEQAHATGEGASGGYEDPASPGASAQKAAEYIANHIGNDGEPDEGSPNQNFGLYLESRQFGSLLAHALVNATDIVPTQSPIEPGERTQLQCGWYLFVTTPTSLREDSQVGTAPIFAVVASNQQLVITEKASVPTVGKKVYEESADTGEEGSGWGWVADAGEGQAVRYRLIGTVSNNISSYDEYQYRFTDTASEGLDIDSEKLVHVYVHRASIWDSSTGTWAEGTETGTYSSSASEFYEEQDNEVTKNFDIEVSEDKKTLTVATKAGKGLRSLKMDYGDETFAMQADDYLTVVYEAHLGAQAVAGEPGNPNEVKITYPADPLHVTETLDSYTTNVKTYTYRLTLHKQDKQNAALGLAGAEFILEKAGDGTDKSYVQEDGSLGSEPCRFTTDSSGNITIANIDRGAYTLTEVKAPPAEQGSGNDEDSYELLDPCAITIGSNVDDLSVSESPELPLTMNVAVPTYENLLFGHGSVLVAADAVDDRGEASGTGVDADAGTVNVVVLEAKETQMPLSGGSGVMAFAVAGGLVIALGAGLLARRRTRASRA